MCKRTKYLEIDQTDFYDVWHWLEEHPYYQYMHKPTGISDSYFQNAISFIDVVKLNPKDETINDDDKLNTATRIWLEPASDFDPNWNCCSTHDWFLDTGGKTFDEAIINLGKLVFEFYGEDTKLLKDPTED